MNILPARCAATRSDCLSLGLWRQRIELTYGGGFGRLGRGEVNGGRLLGKHMVRRKVKTRQCEFGCAREVIRGYCRVSWCLFVFVSEDRKWKGRCKKGVRGIGLSKSVVFICLVWLFVFGFFGEHEPRNRVKPHLFMFVAKESLNSARPPNTRVQG